MKILICSDSPMVSSGYAIQAHSLALALKGAGHDVLYYGMTYSGLPMEYNGVAVVGDSAYNVGNSLLGHYSRAFEADIVLTFKDPYVFSPSEIREISGVWVAVAPVDTEPVGEVLAQSLNDAAYVIALTQFSVKQLAQAGIASYYAPLAVDCEFFKPDQGDGEQFRKDNDIPLDAPLLAVVADNSSKPSRKALDQVLLGFAEAKHDPAVKDAVLYLHTDISTKRGGIDLKFLMGAIQELTEYDVRYTEPGRYDEGLPAEFVRSIYRAADVLVSPSMGEGFGLPIVEAAACGTPAIVTNYTAMRETHGAGWRIPTTPGGTSGVYGGERVWSNRYSFMFLPARHAIAASIKLAVQAKGDEQMSASARNTAMRYNAPAVYRDNWFPLFELIASKLGG